MTALYDPQLYGCIERDSFQLQPSTRILITPGNVPPQAARSGDFLAAPIQASFNTYPSAAQFADFEQWVIYELSCGARPFQIDLWLYNNFQRVRARLSGAYQAKRVAFDCWQVSGAFEIERDGLAVYAPTLPPLRPYLA